ncbi:5-bromo-4-chloroindolyl phosphate hydrolysis family protein [Aerococcaceae bacterium 50-4]
MHRPLQYIAKLGQYPLYWPMNVPLIILLFLLETPYYQMIFWILALSFLVFIISQIYQSNVGESPSYHDKQRLGRIPKSRKAVYEASNLSDQEIQFFRTEMAEALRRIEAVLSYEEYNTHLTMVFKRYDTNKILKSYFQALTQAPDRLSQASDFLYQVLPNLKALLEQYVAINQAMDKSPRKIQKLTKLREEIADLAEQAQSSFDKFTQDV